MADIRTQLCFETIPPWLQVCARKDLKTPGTDGSGTAGLTETSADAQP